MKTPKQAKAEFEERGLPISSWADERGFSRALVYAVLAGRKKGKRGVSHEIAVALGIKPAPRGLPSP
ncbi:DNA-binding protein [Piscinibacter koreensis]|uniref:DNA-binding protein n=1 Tax=Piscinibacter koreensis TaxID=2742824 RepID=A0A7Y6NNZ9_9BURK|nr:DNA-binding protein [Schlegelella koreensis]